MMGVSLPPRKKPVFELKNAVERSVTCIHFNNETQDWEVWYKGVRFAELKDLKEAHDRLQKLLALDSTK
jgi:hypothetical protein